MLHPPFVYTRVTRLLSNQNLKMLVAASHRLLMCLCTDYTRGWGWGLYVLNPQSSRKAGTWCTFLYKGGKEPAIKILKLSNGLIALTYFMSVITTWPLASLYHRCTVMTFHPPHMASTINFLDAWLTLFPNWFLGKRSNDSNSAALKHYKGPKLPTVLQIWSRVKFLDTQLAELHQILVRTSVIIGAQDDISLLTKLKKCKD